MSLPSIQAAKKFWSDHRLLLLILAVTALLYSRSISNGFVNLDDPLLVTGNPHVMHVGWESIKNVFTSYDPELYIPLTLLSYQAEVWTLGIRSWHFHLVNLLLHLGCVLLVYSVALRLTHGRNIAMLVAVLLAVHPLSSEAVLWISARKDLLSAFFFLLSWKLYQSSLDGSKPLYILSLAVFVLALLSKISAATLPLVLLLSLWHLRKTKEQLQYIKPDKNVWPEVLGLEVLKDCNNPQYIKPGIPAWRLQQRPDTNLPIRRASVWPEVLKIGPSLAPFFAFSVLFGIIALLGKPYVFAVEHVGTFIAMALRSTAYYLQLAAVPVGQAAVHPLSAESPIVSAVMLLLSGVLLAMISRLAWLKRQSMPVLLTGWLLYLVTLAPTLLHYTRGGVSSEDILIGSERYAYLPSIGIFLMVASAGVWLYEHRAVSRPTRMILRVLLVCLLFLYCSLTWQRALVFRSSVTFNDDILDDAPLYARAHYNLALALEEAREPQNADDEYAEAMALQPDFADAAINRGILYMREGRTGDALAMFEQSTRMRPEYFKGYFNLGVANQQLEHWDAAIVAYAKTIALFPDFPEVHKNLATVYGKKKMFFEALAEYEILSTLDPGFREQLRASPPAPLPR